MTGIYKITSPTGKTYIGQSVDINRRRLEYKNYGSHSGKVDKSIKKHGFENHTFEILEECTIELLNERERFYQDQFDVLGPNGLNCRLTETSDKSGCLSEETKLKIGIASRNRSTQTLEKISKAVTGRVVSEETKQKLRIFNTGKIKSKETIEKISLGNKNKTLSEEQKKKIGLAHKGKVISTETREKVSKSLTGKVTSKESRLKMSESRKKYLERVKQEKLKNNNNEPT
jgi:group I intron endonuclease